MRLCEQNLIVPIIEPEDHQSSGIDGDSVSMENYDHVTFIFLFGDLTGDAVLTVNSGATAGTKATAETFNYRYTSADLKNDDADQLGSESTSSSLTLTAATYEDRMLIVEVDASELTDGQEWVTPSLSDAASVLFVSCAAVLSKTRYAQGTPPSAVS